MLIQALNSPNLESRLKREENGDRFYRFADLTNSQDVEKYLSSVVSDIHKEHFKEDLKKKRAEEKVRRSKTLIDNLIKCEETEEFVRLLTTTFDTASPENLGTPPLLIPNRTESTYNALFDRLMNSDEISPKRLEKLFVLYLGRNTKEEKVWCNGNPIRDKVTLDKFETLCQKIGDLSLIDQFNTIRNNCKHVYRDSDVPNRHGHCNSFPSWWARGYDSLQAFYKAEPEECIAYATKRRILSKLGIKK